MSCNWIPLFSQTGSEIANLIEICKITPRCIITNNKKIDTIDQRLHDQNLVFIDKVQDLQNYKSLLGSNLVTLHGFLRIIPVEFITDQMYNGHPGLITRFPELKGFNPQQKAFDLKLPVTGSVIHKVIAEVDAGEVVSSKEVNIQKASIEEVYRRLKQCSLELWVEFLNKHLNREQI